MTDRTRAGTSEGESARALAVRLLSVLVAQELARPTELTVDVSGSGQVASLSYCDLTSVPVALVMVSARELPVIMVYMDGDKLRSRDPRRAWQARSIDLG